MIGISNSIGSIIPPITKPIGSIIPSCIFDLDATRIASYAGGDFLNMEGTPADSELQAEYDFETVGASLPVFTGTQGNHDAYFLFDGVGYFKGVNAISDLLKSIHKTTGGSDFTIVFTVYYISATQAFIVTKNANGINQGVDIYSIGATNKLYMNQGDGSANVGALSTATFNASAWNFAAVSHEHSTNRTKFWLNTATGEEFSHTFGTTTTDASGANASIGAYNTGVFPLANGSRIKSIAAFDSVLTDSQIAVVANQLNVRHKASYL